MKIHSLTQGSPEWLAYRSNHFNASDAPAMLGVSPYKTRSELLHELHTGIAPEVDASTQRRFDAGHAAEAAARPIAEEIIGEDLFPVVGSEGKLSASFDGLTMSHDIVFEHKLMNAALQESLANRVIPDSYHPQLEQQLMVSGAEKALFMATSLDRTAMEYVWYTSNPELRSAILQGWTQFAIDLEPYVPAEVIAKPTANAVTALPAVSVQVSGAIAIRENFPAFEVALRDFIDHRLIKNPATDQDFADLESQIKALKNAEAALDAAEVQMLSQVETVDAAKRMKDMLHKLTRDNRLMAEKLLANRKDSIRAEIVADGRNAIASHMTALNMRMGMPLMPSIPVDFANAIKGKRTLESMRDAVSTELARAKIAANEVADKITLNLRSIDAHSEYAFLFADVATLALKDPEFVAMAIKNRIADHQAKEAARLESERSRIAEQERIKAESAAKERADAEIEAALSKAKAEDQKRQFEAQEQSEIKRLSDLNSTLIVEAAKVIAKAQAEPVEVILHNPIGQPTLKLGAIAERLGFQVTEAFLKSLGFEPAMRVKSCVLFHECDFPLICQKLVRHIQEVAHGVTA